MDGVVVLLLLRVPCAALYQTITLPEAFGELFYLFGFSGAMACWV